MDNAGIADKLSRLPTGNLSNAHSDVQAMRADIRPLCLGSGFAGPAKTARIPAGDNAAIHLAVASAKAGDVLVVDGGGCRDFGPFGDILAAGCQNAGIKGLVIDATVRDTRDIGEMGFAVYGLGANPMATTKQDPGEVDTKVSCGGAWVRPGDFIVADDDGVMVVPREIAAEVVQKAQMIVNKEAEIKARLAAGETTVEIFDVRFGQRSA